MMTTRERRIISLSMAKNIRASIRDPLNDGRARHFREAKVVAIENAGHWVHHDRLDAFLDLVRGYL